MAAHQLSDRLAEGRPSSEDLGTGGEAIELVGDRPGIGVASGRIGLEAFFNDP